MVTKCSKNVLVEKSWPDGNLVWMCGFIFVLLTHFLNPLRYTINAIVLNTYVMIYLVVSLYLLCESTLGPRLTSLSLKLTASSQLQNDGWNTIVYYPWTPRTGKLKVLNPQKNMFFVHRKSSFVGYKWIVSIFGGASFRPFSFKYGFQSC